MWSLCLLLLCVLCVLLMLCELSSAFLSLIWQGFHTQPLHLCACSIEQTLCMVHILGQTLEAGEQEGHVLLLLLLLQSCLLLCVGLLLLLLLLLL